jgi:N-acetylmuramoyl-L-alanine amidase
MEHGVIRMKVIYLSKRRIFLIWIVFGMVMFLGVAARIKTPEMIAVFSSPVEKKTIVIDPGHGGFDSGAVSPSGTREDELNLKVALKLKQYLLEHNAEVILTRETNESIVPRKSEDMRKRIDIIRENNPDVVISIHMNKFPQSQYFGGQTFYMTGSEKGKKLAQSIQTKLLENLIEGNTRQIKAVSNMIILKAGSAPAVIVECGFLSNAKEESLLITNAYQDKIAWSIFNGILDYFANEEAFYWDGVQPPSQLS